MNLVIPGLTLNPVNRNPARTNNGVLRTSLDTGFRRYDVRIVFSPTQ